MAVKPAGVSSVAHPSYRSRQNPLVVDPAACHSMQKPCSGLRARLMYLMTIKGLRSRVYYAARCMSIVMNEALDLAGIW